VETIVLVVGLLLAAYCLLVAIKPEWFKNFSLMRPGSRGSARLGDTPTGLLRVIYLGVAVALVVVTLVIHDFVREDRVCDEARAVFDAGRTGWAEQAAAQGYKLRVSRTGSLARYQLVKDGTVVATWSDAGWGLQLRCPPES
jgi:hypothetical protein